MKRCPQCNRLESDDALSFCRVDGTPLVGDSAYTDPDAGTMRLGSGPVAAEAETSRLTDANTNVSNVRQTGPTTILPERPEADRTQALRKPKSLRVVMVSVFAILIIAAATYAYYVTRKSNTVISTIAVMPFVNASGNADVEYLSDGMTETLISSLSQLPKLSVRPRSTVFRYKGKETNLQTIAKELNVQAILTGRVVLRGQDVSLFVELIDVTHE
jgi:TolB-like protein